MERTIKTAITALLAALLLVSMAACGGGAGNPAGETTAPPTSGSATDGGSTTPPPADPSAQTTSAGEEPVDLVFDFDSKTVTLNNGIEMPILGIGMFRLSNEQAENSVYWALRDGYRLIDTARIYGNEEGVGRGIRRAIGEGLVTREEVFVTTKMWTADFGNGEAAINASLDRLGLDYIDLMILHHSQPSNDVDAYKAIRNGYGILVSVGRTGADSNPL
jgi:predicted small lipoprotein YifL